jgi:hypothetical protein
VSIGKIKKSDKECVRDEIALDITQNQPIMTVSWRFFDDEKVNSPRVLAYRRGGRKREAPLPNVSAKVAR